MNLPVVGELISQVRFDFAVTLLTDGDNEFRLECQFELAADGSPAERVDPQDLDNVAAHAGTLVRQRGRRITAARVTDGGVLDLRIGDDTAIRVHPDDDYESWTYAGVDGVKAVGLPGGGLATWGLA